MLNIAIIGAGQIGSRYLQVLSYLEKPAVIQVVNPIEQCRKLAEDRFKKVCHDTEKKNSLSLHANIDNLGTHFILIRVLLQHIQKTTGKMVESCPTT